MNKISKVKKAVFPVAGMGTRFLPATKASPKEMMPIVDKPLIQYAVEEAVRAGITELIFVTSSSKRAIEDHFDSNFELETKLKAQGKSEFLNLVQSILPEGVSCVYIRQPEALGLGNAILCAKSVIGNDPFAILLADDLIKTENQMSCLEQMVAELPDTGVANMIAVERIVPEDSTKYGIVGFSEIFGGFNAIDTIVEKPKPEVAPSHYAVVGRYILRPEIFKFLAIVKPGANGEIQLTDAIAALLEEQSVYALAYQGKRFDCGSKLGYLQAIVTYGLQHPEVSVEFEQYLKSIAMRQKITETILE